MIVGGGDDGDDNGDDGDNDADDDSGDSGDDDDHGDGFCFTWPFTPNATSWLPGPNME